MELVFLSTTLHLLLNLLNELGWLWAKLCLLWKLFPMTTRCCCCWWWWCNQLLCSSASGEFPLSPWIKCLPPYNNILKMMHLSAGSGLSVANNDLIIGNKVPMRKRQNGLADNFQSNVITTGRLFTLITGVWLITRVRTSMKQPFAELRKLGCILIGVLLNWLTQAGDQMRQVNSKNF